MFLSHRQSHLAIAGFAYHFEVIFEFDQLGQPFAEQRVIIHKQNAGGLRVGHSVQFRITIEKWRLR